MWMTVGPQPDYEDIGIEGYCGCERDCWNRHFVW